MSHSLPEGAGGSQEGTGDFAALLSGEAEQGAPGGLPAAAPQTPPVAGAISPVAAEEISPVDALTELLAALEAALKAGETPAPDLLEKIEAALEAVAALLEPGRALAGQTPGGAGLPPGGQAGGAAPILPPGLVDKLAALVGTLGAGTDSPELKAIVEQVLAKADKAQASSVPALGAAELKLPEAPALTAKKPTPAAGQGVAPQEDSAAVPEEAVRATPSSREGGDRPAPATPAVADRREPPAGTLPPAAVTTGDPAITLVATTSSTAGAALDGGAVRAAHGAYQGAPINLPHLAFEIVRQVQAGVSKFQIRLDPPELGRIEVQLDMDAKGQTNARLTVERAETFDLLQRDQRALERALAQAGLDAGKTNLEFSLKQNPFARQDGGGQEQAGRHAAAGGGSPLLPEADAAQAVAVYRGSASPGGINMFV